MKNKFIIYGLADPVTEDMRYVGRSSSGMKRPREHSCPKNLEVKRSYCVSWIKSLNGQKPKIKILERVPNQVELDVMERYWIMRLRKLGCRLTNLTDGGGGTRNFKHTEEAKIKISKAFSGENHPGWKGGKPKCVDCGTVVGNYGSVRCDKCARKGELSPCWKGGKPDCPDCGKTLSRRESKKCRKCASKNKVIDYNCGHCGKKLSGAPYKVCRDCKNIRPIEVYSADGTFVGIWDSAANYAKEFSACYRSIWCVLKGKRASYKGVVFKYVEEEKGGVSLAS